jgi:hypothetical protein
MRYSAAEDQLWHKHGRTVLHPKDAFDDAIRNGMDEEGMRDTTECTGTSGRDIFYSFFYESTGTFRAQW